MSLFKRIFNAVKSASSPEVAHEKTVSKDNPTHVYTVSHETLEDGYEDVYQPLMVILEEGEGILVFARFTCGDIADSLESASQEVVNYITAWKEYNTNITYQVTESLEITPEEQQAIQKIEQVISSWIQKVPSEF